MSFNFIWSYRWKIYDSHVTYIIYILLNYIMSLFGIVVAFVVVVLKKQFNKKYFLWGSF
jgi:hypothetical protein